MEEVWSQSDAPADSGDEGEEWGWEHEGDSGPVGEVGGIEEVGEAAQHSAGVYKFSDDRVKLLAVPVRLKEAQEFVLNFHRHNKPPAGGVFAVGVSDGCRLVGVAIVGRPVARFMDNGETLEVTRCCVMDDAPKGSCSFLYARCWQAAKALGWKKLITYTLQSESGASMKGAGWKCVAELKPNNPDMWKTRPGRDWQPVVGQAKFRWEA